MLELLSSVLGCRSESLDQDTQQASNFPRGSIYTTIMELGSQNYKNSTMVVHMDTLTLGGRTTKP